MWFPKCNHIASPHTLAFFLFALLNICPAVFVLNLRRPLAHWHDDNPVFSARLVDCGGECGRHGRPTDHIDTQNVIADEGYSTQAGKNVGTPCKDAGSATEGGRLCPARRRRRWRLRCRFKGSWKAWLTKLDARKRNSLRFQYGISPAHCSKC